MIFHRIEVFKMKERKAPREYAETLVKIIEELDGFKIIIKYSVQVGLYLDIGE